MARINSYKKTDNVDNSDVFIIDSTSGNNGTRTVLWSTIKRIFTDLFAAKTHRHDAHDIDGTLSIDRLPTVPITKGGTGATTVDGAREALNAAVKNHGHMVNQIVGGIGSPTVLAHDADLNNYVTAEKAGYYIGPNGNRITNKPDNIDDFGFYVLKTGTNGNTSVMQLIVSSTQQLYLRKAWALGKGWKRLIREDDTINRAHHADYADIDGSNQNIANTYIKEITVNGTTVTVKRGNNSTYTFTTQDTRYQIADDTHDGMISARMHQTFQWAYERYLEFAEIVDHNGTPSLRFRNGATTGPHLTIYLDAAGNNRSGIMAASDWAKLHDMKTINQMVEIHDGTDLDNVRTPGYYSVMWKNNQQVPNLPFDESDTGTLIVFQHFPTNELTQVFVRSRDAKLHSGRGMMYLRYFDNNYHWQPWTDITAYPSATQSQDGLMTAADKRKLDGLSGDYGGTIGLVTSSKDGLMSKTDKVKLDAAETINAPKYQQAGSDLNDLKKPGYYSIRWIESQSMQHKPFPNQGTGMLIVMSAYNTNDAIQLYIGNNGYIRIRNFNAGGSKAWTEWTGLDDNESISTGAIDAMFNS